MGRERQPVGRSRGILRVLGGMLGAWLLIGGVAASFWLRFSGILGWGICALSVYAAVVGALLLAEAFLARRPSGRLRREEEAERVGVALAPTPELRRGMVPIWLHLTLGVVLMLVGMAGGAIVGIRTSSGIVALALGGPWAAWTKGLESVDGLVYIPFVFAGIILTGVQTRRLFRAIVPARCPRCGGPAHAEWGSTVRYRCRACQGVQETSWEEP